MAADGQVNVNIKVTADTAGGAKAKASVEGVGKAATSAATQAKASAGVFKTAFTSVGTAVNACAKAISGVTKALGVIGFAINAVQMIVDAFHKLHDWLHKDEIAAAKLAEEVRKQKYAESVARSAAEYEKLNKSVAENIRMEQQKNGLLDERTSMERNLEDAKMRKEEADEIMALDADDPDYDSKAALIRQKYARKRSEVAAERAGEDNRTEVKRLYDAATAKDKEAADYHAQTDWGSDAKRNVIEKRAEYEDVSAAAAGGDKKAQERLEAVKREYEEAKAAYEKLKEAEAAATKAAKELREQAANKTGGNLPAKIANEATQTEIDVQERATKKNMERAQQERKAQEDERKRKEEEEREKKRKSEVQKNTDEATIKEGGEQISAIKANIAQIEGRAEEERAADAKEQLEAWQAKQNLETFNANHAGRKMSRADRAEQQRLTESVQKETAEAQESAFKLEKTLKQFADVISGFNEMLKRVEREVDAAEKRQRNAQTESPAGA